MHKIQLAPTPMTTAKKGGVHADALGRQTGETLCQRLRGRRRLGRHMDVAAVWAHVGGTVHRLHTGMGLEGHLIDRLDLQCRLGEGTTHVAFTERHGRAPVQTEVQTRAQMLGRHRCIAERPALDLEPCPAAQCRPGGLSYDRDTLFHHKHIDHTWRGAGGLSFPGANLGADHWAALDRGIQHPR
jgi:hypothetical protein